MFLLSNAFKYLVLAGQRTQSTTNYIIGSKYFFYYSSSNISAKKSKGEIIQELANNQKQNIIKKSTNSVENEEGNMAFCHALPSEWSEAQLVDHLDPDRNKIQRILFVKNRIGQKTGKALIFFKNKEFCDQFLKKYSENFIDAPDVLQRILAKPFTLKSQSNKLKAEKNLKQVYLANLPFQCNSDELYYLAQDFGEVDYVDLPMQRDGKKNKGFAFVKFKRAEAALKFRDYLSEHEFMARKVRAQIQYFEFDTQKKRYTKQSDFIVNQSEENVKDTNLDENMKLYEDLTKEMSLNTDSHKK